MVQIVNTFYEPGVLTVLASGRVGIGMVNPGATLDVNGDGRFANALTVASGGIQVTGDSTITGDVTVTGTGAFKNLIASDGIKIGTSGDNIAQLNHGNATVSVSVDGAVLNATDATLTSKVQTVSLSIGGCATGSRLLVTPSTIPDGLALTKAACTGNGAAAITFTNYTTAAKAGSVTVSYEVIR